MICDGVLVELGRDDDLGEEPFGPEGLAEAAVRFHDRAGQLDVHGPVQGDDPAEGADDVALIRFAIGDVDVARRWRSRRG